MERRRKQDTSLTGVIQWLEMSVPVVELGHLHFVSVNRLAKVCVYSSLHSISCMRAYSYF